MSEIDRLSLVLALAASLAGAGAASADPLSAADAAALAKADRLRTPVVEGEAKAVMLLKAGELTAPPMPYDVRIAADGARIVLATGGERAGQKMLARDEGFWMLIPGRDRLVRLPHIQRMIGAAAFADIGRIRLSKDYEVEAKEAGPDGGAVYRLAARSEATIFRRVVLTLDAHGVPTRMTLLYPSGKVLREVTFGPAQEGPAGPFVREMTIFDPLDPSRRAVIESFDFVDRAEDAAAFRPEAFSSKS